MPTTLNLRALRLDDAPAVTSILAEMERREPVDEAYDEPEVIEEMSSPAIDLARGSAAVLDGDTLVAFGALSISAPAATWKASLWGGVHPDHTHRGIGRRVIDHLVDRAREIRDADNPGAPGELKIWVESSRPGTAAVGADAGFDTWRYFVRMRRALDDPVQQLPAPDGLLIRPYRYTDDDAVRLVSNESFADHWGSTPMDAVRWRAEFADSTSFQPDHSFVALAAPDPSIPGSVAGFVLTSEFHGDTEHRGYRTGYIARVGTSRSARGHGVASALLARTLTGLAESGYLFAELGVDAESPTGAGRLYERAGFRTFTNSRVLGLGF
jgi:mycothiol synthase